MQSFRTSALQGGEHVSRRAVIRATLAATRAAWTAMSASCSADGLGTTPQSA